LDEAVRGDIQGSIPVHSTPISLFWFNGLAQSSVSSLMDGSAQRRDDDSPTKHDSLRLEIDKLST